MPDALFLGGLVGGFSLWTRAWTDAECAAFESGTDAADFADRSGLVYDLPLDADAVEAHSGATVTIAGSPAPYTGTIPPLADPPSTAPGLAAGWPKISPCRQLVGFLMADDGSVAAVSSVPGTPTLTLDGTTVIDLAGPLYAASDGGNFVAFPVDPAPVSFTLDDPDATLTGSGWASWAGTPNVLLGGSLRYSETPTDTALYSFSGLTPGDYRISVNALTASSTTDAQYSCDDGTLAAQVLHDDPTAPTANRYDFARDGIAYCRLGKVTVSGTTLDVTVSNAAGRASSTSTRSAST